MNKEKYRQLLEKKKKYEAKLASLKKRLGHPHLDMMSDHDLAESDFRVYSALFDDIEEEIRKLKRG